MEPQQIWTPKNEWPPEMNDPKKLMILNFFTPTNFLT
jgi:hypothetical protein